MLSRAATRRAYSTAAAQAVVKTTAKDTSGNLTNLTVVVNNAGAKVGKSGIAHLLSKFNFLNTGAKSALRFTRESELLGAQFSSNVTRDALVLNTSFLKADLPYFVEALGNVLVNTSFRPHELVENVYPTAKADYETAIKSNSYVGLEELHELSFRKGLGNGLLYDGSNKITLDEIKQFAQQAYTKSNVSVFGAGAVEEDLVKFINESPFAELPTGETIKSSVSIFKGKESRIKTYGESAVLVGIPIKPTEFGKFEVLSSAIGSSVLSSDISAPLFNLPGVDASSTVLKYQDAGLFVITIKGASSADVSAAVKQVKKIVESADLKSATKKAELSIALQSTFEAPLSLKVDATTPIKLVEFNYVAVGEVDALPYADEL
ncbi:ubiquinol-cytochrome-c reductase complex core protein 2 mitochondrial precursor [Scheffersomyces coipomensis]|uniref:ubiquinol-cytochrome-c reductase complex core protein 2 mitochondrial precursor n=1 Tax=Scheffersomyces coipomensis TaxID=1788519 RepID=UPI00315DCEF3